MPNCPAGHSSRADDYCDICGARMAGPPPAAPAPAGSADVGDAGGECPDCSTPRTGRFCENCGYDFAVGAGRPTVTGPMRIGPPSTGWTAVVTADRDYYEKVLGQADGPDAGAFAFPPYCPERRIPLTGQQVRIGRRSVSQGTVPEIDLAEPPEDPGASHTHAVLLAQADGTWNLVDPGSTNGTTINGGDDPIAVNVAVPMDDGDRIHVGVWTTIMLRRG
jgi:hypothetical protein